MDAFATCSRLFSVALERIHELHLPCLGRVAAAHLVRHGWAVVDDWMDAEAVAEVERLAAASACGWAEGGSDGVEWRAPEPRHARTDLATWLKAGERPACEPVFADRVLPRFDALAVDLGELMEGVGSRLEVQLAHFSGGKQARYRRHTDATADPRPESRERKVTCILYCNSTWVEASEGCLRLTRADCENATGLKARPEGARGTAGSTMDIPPIGGRLLCLLSGAMVHEVLPTKADRIAVTAWVA